ncbi:MAG: chorismate mutase [Rubrobacteraceae bacterium]
MMTVYSLADTIPDLMENAEIQEKMQTLRERVNEVDQDLVRALNERASIVQEIVAMKAEAGVPLFDPRREEEILQRAMEYNDGPIYDTSMREIFELILHRIRDLEIQRGEFYS